MSLGVNSVAYISNPLNKPPALYIATTKQLQTKLFPSEYVHESYSGMAVNSPKVIFLSLI